MAPDSSAQARRAPARLLLVDDHELARAGLRALLADERAVTVVGEASNGREAVELAAHLRPDLVLMDIRMPDMDGLTATRVLKERCPTAAVLMVTTYSSPEYLFEAVKAGAAGYLLKQADRAEIIGAIRKVLAGEALLDPQLATQLLRRLAGETRAPSGHLIEPLTRRELEVLRLVADGQTNREIAERLTISRGTVKAHVERIIAKLGVSDRTQAAVRAIELQILPAERT